VRGFLTADVAVQGTWETPRLAGAVELLEGTALVPDLGVRYGPFNGRIRLTGDSLVVDTAEVGGRDGRLVATGHLRLENLTRPVLGLDFQAFDFLVMDVPDYLRIQADGQVRLRGPLYRATMTGSATLRNSVVYFADLVQKSIVNLEDPLYADLVDTATIRRRGLGAAFQSRFLDSLRIQDFQFRAAEGVWLRSNEANIQLEGGVTVQKNRNLYRLDGEFNAVRGTYNLKLLAITRSFEVTRGEVRYFGEPDLNADLDIQARHTLPPVGPEGTTRDVEVTATISGTLRQPRLSLMSNIYPPLSQSDLISLLIFRRPVNQNQLVAGQSGATEADMAGSLLLQTVASELERVLRGDSQVGLDLIEIRPGESYASGQASLTRLSAGWQLGDRWFVSLITGICRDFQQFDYRNFGASLDYRLGGHASASVSAEPYQTCLAGSSTVGTKRYQFGADLRWGREY
jgi:translocation and assembly module TamB